MIKGPDTAGVKGPSQMDEAPQRNQKLYLKWIGLTDGLTDPNSYTAVSASAEIVNFLIGKRN